MQLHFTSTSVWTTSWLILGSYSLGHILDLPVHWATSIDVSFPLSIRGSPWSISQNWHLSPVAGLVQLSETLCPFVTWQSVTMTATIYKHKHLFLNTMGKCTHFVFCFEQWHVHCKVFCTSSGHIWLYASSLILPSTGWGWKFSWPQVRCSWRF